MDFLELRRIEPLNKHGFIHWDKDRAAAKESGKRLITHELVNCYADEEGNSTFDRMIIRDYETGEQIAVYEDDEIEQANHDYDKYGWYHATCYME